MMKERPILFSGEMVQAILEGRKCQTRRVIKPPIPDTHFEWNNHGDDDLFFWIHYPGQGEKGNVLHRRCPYGARCTRLWVRETWAIVDHNDYELCLRYKADPGDDWWFAVEPETFDKYTYENFNSDWRPSIHMPRWASRITLEITGIRVERIQDISVEDMVAEGITPNMAPTHAPYWQQNARHHFIELWESINYHRGFGWDSNPWVWAITFKRVGEQAQP